MLHPSQIYLYAGHHSLVYANKRLPKRSSILLYDHTCCQGTFIDLDVHVLLLLIQTPRAGLICFTLSIVSMIIPLRMMSSILPFHPFVTMVSCRWMTVAATQSQPHTGVSHKLSTQGKYVPSRHYRGGVRYRASSLPF